MTANPPASFAITNLALRANQKVGAREIVVAGGQNNSDRRVQLRDTVAKGDLLSHPPSAPRDVRLLLHRSTEALAPQGAVPRFASRLFSSAVASQRTVITVLGSY
jgi:hypothetical protein